MSPDGAAGPSPKGPRWSRHLGRVLAHGLWRTEVLGAENVPRTGPVVLAANHIGAADGPVLHGAAPRDTHILVKAEMFHGPVGAILRAAGQIPVDRTNGRPALVAALAVLRRGGAVGIFPEGARGRGDGGDSRAGVAWLAVQGGAPVVPVAVLGTRRTGESVHHVPRPRRRFVVAFGEPLHLDPVAGQSRRDAITAAHDVLRVALTKHVQETAARTGVELPLD